MASFTCSGCGAPLVIHCGNVDCPWWHCQTRACDHDIYDVERGVLLYCGGRVEVLGA